MSIFFSENLNEFQHCPSLKLNLIVSICSSFVTAQITDPESPIRVLKFLKKFNYFVLTCEVLLTFESKNSRRRSKRKDLARQSQVRRRHCRVRKSVQARNWSSTAFPEQKRLSLAKKRNELEDGKTRFHPFRSRILSRLRNLKESSKDPTSRPYRK